MERGDIKLYRSVMDNFVWNKGAYSYGQAWAHLLLIANHKEGTIWVQSSPVKILRGQVGWSKEKLQKKFKWTRSKLRTFIKHLKNDHMIDHVNIGKISIITILNYDKYHGSDQSNDQAIANPSPSGDQAIATNKKDKKDKNVKKEYIAPRLGEHENVLLTRNEFDKLHAKLGQDKLDDIIERLSGYVASTGKKYKSHYATVLNWNRSDGNGAPKPTAPTMTAEQEAKRNMLKNELGALYETLENKKQVPEGHPIYEKAQRDIVGINKRIDKIESELEG